MDVPDLARPSRARLVGLDCKPLVAGLLVDLLVLCVQQAEGVERKRRRNKINSSISQRIIGDALLTWISAMYSSLTRSIQASPSRGPALVLSIGSFCTVAFVASSGPDLRAVRERGGALRELMER